uniref:Uncharacterized protein n=1 Tax=Rhizophora mucronata TaxID=61149 RepID=A0A2P2P0D8_RHIMU
MHVIPFFSIFAAGFETHYSPTLGNLLVGILLVAIVAPITSANLCTHLMQSLITQSCYSDCLKHLRNTKHISNGI